MPTNSIRQSVGFSPRVRGVIPGMADFFSGGKLSQRADERALAAEEEAKDRDFQRQLALDARRSAVGMQDEVAKRQFDEEAADADQKRAIALAEAETKHSLAKAYFEEFLRRNGVAKDKAAELSAQKEKDEYNDSRVITEELIKLGQDPTDPAAVTFMREKMAIARENIIKQSELEGKTADANMMRAENLAATLSSGEGQEAMRQGAIASERAPMTAERSVVSKMDETKASAEQKRAAVGVAEAQKAKLEEPTRIMLAPGATGMEARPEGGFGVFGRGSTTEEIQVGTDQFTGEPIYKKVTTPGAAVVPQDVRDAMIAETQRIQGAGQPAPAPAQQPVEYMSSAYPQQPIGVNTLTAPNIQRLPPPVYTPKPLPTTEELRANPLQVPATTDPLDVLSSDNIAETIKRLLDRGIPQQ